MECNKDEALRAKKIAERKVAERDYVGAKKFASKAQTLYPELEGIPQLLTILDVYISAEKKINGEVDWYAVLGTNPWVDDETVRKQFKKMVMALHPDKNQAVGADGAFNLVADAWRLLSDKSKRLAYNEMLNPKVQLNHPAQSGVPFASPSASSIHTSTAANIASQARSHKSTPRTSAASVPAQNGVPFASPSAKSIHTSTANVTLQARSHKSTPRTSPASVPAQSGVPFASPSANRIHTSTANVTSLARSHNSAPQKNPASVPSSSTPNPGTFWTICQNCTTHYEYLRIYLNHILLCPTCGGSFPAEERPGPPNAISSFNLPPCQQHQNSRTRAANSNLHNSGGSTGLNSSNRTKLEFGKFYRDGKRKEASSSNATRAAASVGRKAHAKSKKEREAHAKSKRACEETPGTSKRRRINDRGDVAMRNGVGSGSISETRKSSFEAESTYGFSGIHNKPNSRRELSMLETQNVLMSKAQIEIRKNLTNANSNKEKMKMKAKESRKQKNMDNSDLHDLSEHDGTNEKNQNKESLPGSSDGDSDKEATMIIVPDSDFHNFDLDRTESSFGDDQVWAAYDDEDGMPRFYAKINEVISLKPFKIRISWLNSRSNSELGPLHWVDCGFTKTCGDFRAGKHDISETLNTFSHKVKWIKGTRGVIRIFPSKGDVWALYRNWSPSWNENTPDEVIHKYDMVEVLDDYSEGQGVSVTPLVKVAGFKTVFRKHWDPKAVKRIPKEEMFCFSHQVPSCLLTGQEAQNAPAGCWELDPGATPSELIQTSTEVNEAPVAENGEKADEGRLQNAPTTEADEVGESHSKAGEGEVECQTSQQRDTGRVVVAEAAEVILLDDADC